jgi:hypothetical protein
MKAKTKENMKKNLDDKWSCNHSLHLTESTHPSLL